MVDLTLLPAKTSLGPSLQAQPAPSRPPHGTSPAFPERYLVLQFLL